MKDSSDAPDSGECRGGHYYRKVDGEWRCAECGAVRPDKSKRTFRRLHLVAGYV